MPEKILIIDDDVDTLRLVGLMLQRQGYQIIAANNGPQGLSHAQAELPALILLDVMMPGMDGYEVAKRLRASAQTANIPILMFTAKSQLDDKVAGFESGADDYLTKPTHPTELQAHVKALLARSEKSRAANPPTTPTEPNAYMVGVLSARGGMGVSTVAANLAASLVARSSGDVVLAEMRPGQGNTAIDLGIANPKGLNTLLNSPVNEITRARIREELVPHVSGIKILASSFQPRDTVLTANSAQFEAITHRMAYVGSFVVFDLGVGLPAATQSMVKSMTEILIVTDPAPGTALHTRALIEDLIDLGIDQSRIFIVANYRSRSDLQLTPSQLQEQLGQPVAVSISPALELLLQANRAKTPAVIAQPETQLASQFGALAGQVAEHAPKTHRK